ncbi:hypothetical protein KEM54_005311 [Ascosphaera aggregata]|nr:hypothetical protein KEM54_005311 [Ascosphaera aggregata]
MAPRRKKKTLSNPARGFSTVSTPSKFYDVTAASAESTVAVAATQSKAPVQNVNVNGNAKVIGNVSGMKEQNDKLNGTTGITPTVKHEAATEEAKLALHEMSPEELEEYLKDAELQTLIDQYGPKCLNDSSRQISKLEAEKRVLRGQAMSLNVTDWLTPSIIDEIIELERAEVQKLLHQSLPAGDDEATRSLELDACVKLYTLRETLIGLGFEQDAVEQVLSKIFYLTPQEVPPTSRDSVWGLDAALKWLALHSGPEQLPPYRTDCRAPQLQIDDISDDELADSSSEDKISIPVKEVAKLAESQSTAFSSTSNIVDSVLEGFGSNDDPETLIPKFMALRCRLFEEDPSIFDCSRKSGKKGKKSGVANSSALSPNGQQLQKKIAEIENDILFDKDTAEALWQDKLFDLRRESIAAKRRGGEGENKNPDDHGAVDSAAPAQDAEVPDATVTDAEQSNPEAEEDDILGRMFGVSSDVPFPEDGQSEKEPASQVTIVIRDFGKLVGMSPRRILEDSCRSRDSGSKVSFKPLTKSTYSNRQEVQIRWSKAQEIPPRISIANIKYTANSRTIRVSMDSIATPTATQAEWYISTVALFLVFSYLPKERRAAMKLPATFKDLFEELAQEKKNQEDEKSKVVLKGIQEMVQEHLSSLDHDVVLTANFRRRNGGASTPRIESASSSRRIVIDNQERLVQLWNDVSSKPSFKRMAISRQNLPIWSFKEQILTTLDANQVLIICSETGSGKSTQIPSFILERELMSGRSCKIWVTEPRRISATSLARRVSEELGEERNAVGSNHSLVGHVIRLESKISSSTRLVFATTGVVVRMLERPKDLQDITHLVLDEVHERTIESDFLLIILRRLIHERPTLKLVLMSATVDATRFSTYLGNAPILNIPGRTFPVEVKYLEDAVELTKHAPQNDPLYAEGQDSDDDEDEIAANSSSVSNSDLVASLSSYSKQTQRTVAAFDEYQIDCELIVNLIMKIATDPSMEMYSKAILVFMPGSAEIRRLYDELMSRQKFFNADAWAIHVLHSSIASDEQDKAFLVPPEGMRKIVIATNIAETGITIPDITAVIDTGKEKVMRFDEKRQFSKLVESFISCANAKQRRGRAGRVQNGLCFHLFTKYRHDNLMSKHQTPEMLRLSLQDLVLRVKICKLGDVEQTLLEALDPPSNRNIRRSIEALKDVKALTPSENLTFLGQQLAKLPLDVFLGKLIVYGAFFGCLDAALSIAAILSSKSPFVSAVGSQSERDTAKLAMKRGNSDLLTVYNAYLGWKKSRETPGSSEFAFCRKNHLSIQALSSIEDIKVQLAVSFVDTGLFNLTQSEKALLNRASYMSGRQRQSFKVPERFDKYSNDDMVVNSVVAWSFYPRLLIREGKTGWRSIANNQTVKLHITSVNRQLPSAPPHSSRLRHLNPLWRPSSPSNAQLGDLLPPFRFVSYYHMMQARSRAYQAHEISAVDDFAVALLCGELEVRLHAGVLLIDGGSRAKFAVDSWRCAIAMKSLSERVREALAAWIRGPSRVEPEKKKLRRLEDDIKWIELWGSIFGGMLQRRASRMNMQVR